MTVALLGTGLLGRAIAERLRATHHPVIAYNRTAARARGRKAPARQDHYPDGHHCSRRERGDSD